MTFNHDWSRDPRSESSTEKNHRGMGPKGWKRSDEAIKEEASELLYLSWDVDASQVEVLVEDGVITLRGKMGDRDQKKEAERLIENLMGVTDVRNEITVAGSTRGEGWVPGLGKVEVDHKR